jgi:anti-sigma factor RsiW
MNCPDVHKLEHAYVDGELDLATSLELERHVAACAECGARQSRLKLLTARVRIEAPRHAASEALRARVAGLLEAEPTTETTIVRRRPSPAPMGVARWAAALAAAFVLGWVMSLVFAPRDAGFRPAEDVVAAHIRALRTNHLAEIASSDQHAVKPWLTARLDFAAPVDDFSAEDFALAGGRLDYVSHQTVAALVYRRREHVINLFVWPDQTDAARPVTLTVDRGFNVARFSTRGMRFAAVSDLNREELRKFAELVASRR